MKKGVIISTIIALVLFSTITFAETVVVVGTGSAKGFYTTKAFPKIAQQTKSWGVKLEAKPGGSKINIKRMLAGEIQVAMVQFDAVIDADNSSIIIIGFLHDEVIHALTLWDHKINELSDVKKGHKVGIGKPTGGSALTWSVWANAVKQLGEVGTEPLQGTRAISALEAGDIDLFFSVTGMGDKYFKQANGNKKKFKLVELDFGAIDKLKYKKTPIYNEFEIEDKYYPNLIKGMSDPDVYTVKACLVTTADWSDENEDTYEVIADAVAAARPSIIQLSLPKLGK